MKNKNVNILDCLIYISFVIIFLVVLFCGGINYSLKREFLTNNIILLIVACLMLLVGYCIYVRFKKENVKKTHKKYQKYLFWVIVCAVQIVFCVLLYFYTSWDVGGYVLPAARALALNHNDDFNALQYYFSEYPNNSMIVMLYAVMIRIGIHISPAFYEVSQSVMLLICFQCVLSSITGYLLSEMVYDYTENDHLKRISIIFYFILIGFSPWLIIPYSDSTGLIFPILILRLYQSLSNKKYTLFKIACIAFLTYWGYTIKPQIAIVTIAVIMVTIIDVFKTKRKVLEVFSIKKLLTVIVVVVISSFSYHKLISLAGFQLTEGKVMSVPHFVMMGLNEESNGIWNADDVQFSESFNSNEERNEADLQRAKERVQTMGVGGLLKHLERKTLTIFNDGTYSFGTEGDFYSYVARWNNGFVNLLRNLIYSEGSLYIYTSTIRQAVWLILLLFTILSCFDETSSKQKRILLFSIAGSGLFQLLFEARARYLYIYVPFYIVLTMIGFSAIPKRIDPILKKLGLLR